MVGGLLVPTIRRHREVSANRQAREKRLRRVGSTEPLMVGRVLEGESPGPSGAFLGGGCRRVCVVVHRCACSVAQHPASETTLVVARAHQRADDKQHRHRNSARSFLVAVALVVFVPRTISRENADSPRRPASLRMGHLMICSAMTHVADTAADECEFSHTGRLARFPLSVALGDAP